ncbi:MAG: adenylyltransferase/cytidyltransferase family protein [bacterium]|nr:adenylyltransferase/cytidyltransferase family protein [bacterium]
MNRILSADELLAHWETGGRPGKVVFTNGCFDLLSRGHIAMLEAARELGDCLVVGLNDDDSVQRLKGPNRPFLSLEVRGTIIAALRAVDFVVPFSEDTPLKLIKMLKPEVLVKGGDYNENEIVGAQEVQSWGGKVEVVPLKKALVPETVFEPSSQNDDQIQRLEPADNILNDSTSEMAYSIFSAMEEEIKKTGLYIHRPYPHGIQKDNLKLLKARDQTRKASDKKQKYIRKKR